MNLYCDFVMEDHVFLLRDLYCRGVCRDGFGWMDLH